MATAHIQAEKGAIAPVVLMPGDPLRAKFIAETYLEEVVCFNQVRNMFGYTGLYKGVRVSVMGSGMGMPSIGIYSYELFTQFDVQAIIRIGTAGGYQAQTKVFDVVLASAAFSESTFGQLAFGDDRRLMPADSRLNEVLRESAVNLDKDIHEGVIHSSDVFYHASEAYRAEVDELNCLAVEMESFALFTNALHLGKQASCLLTISDSFVTKEVTTAQQRETAFTNMIEIALDAAVRY